jgi:hypothetical protein
VAFIWQRSCEPLQWRHISRNIEGYNIEDKISLRSRRLVRAGEERASFVLVLVLLDLPLKKTYFTYAKNY